MSYNYCVKFLHIYLHKNYGKIYKCYFPLKSKISKNMFNINFEINGKNILDQL